MRQVIEDLVNADYSERYWVNDGRLEVIEYGSKKLTQAQRNWDARERELWAVKYFVTKWDPYIRLKPTLVLTDLRSLTSLAKADTGKVVDELCSSSNTT
ncbi:hypothetical protein GNI_097820 [Gregarina niphandrodes]|uniref:Reverse transcriptase RNase H-like domain-containing protein n=1 Tax=Gregarina niphandrodes TaxID=110365 RepID=A0A023B4V3_GRENI|nr:hypothetical protein GNI_097820 [Gregarina niphandrodes]EZG57375.1 hypothetical protein GNI_097820 [Gregarina niphandrodes]|eukprot:XP_011131053.1 hypothetical protein GNI_097820 [Gregarina niphandrodes]